MKNESATKANFNLTQSDIWEESAFIDPEAPFSLSKCVTVNLPNDLKNQHLSLEVTVNVSSIDMLFWEFNQKDKSGVYTRGAFNNYVDRILPFFIPSAWTFFIP